MSWLVINFLVNCGDPNTPIDGYIGYYLHTREGSTVEYGCNDGFRPSANRLSICSTSSMWIPLPEQHVCTLVVGRYAQLNSIIEFLLQQTLR